MFGGLLENAIAINMHRRERKKGRLRKKPGYSATLAKALAEPQRVLRTSRSGGEGVTSSTPRSLKQCHCVWLLSASSTPNTWGNCPSHLKGDTGDTSVFNTHIYLMQLLLSFLVASTPVQIFIIYSLEKKFSALLDGLLASYFLSLLSFRCCYQTYSMCHSSHGRKAFRLKDLCPKMQPDRPHSLQSFRL